MIPLPWNQFYSYFSPPGLKSDGTVFLHERTSPAGHHRLIAVDLYDIQSAPTQIMCFARVIDLGGIFITGDQRPQPSEGMFTLPLPNPHCLIFAGTPDPADPSHFTFTISTGSDQRTIDGWLRDDDRVVMELRKPTVQNP